MPAVLAESLDQFRVKFAELARAKRGVQIDPYLIAQAVAHVMRQCTVRSATGRPIVWNDYRLVLARKDFDLIRPLQAILERDLKLVLAEEARARSAELVGELKITVVFDEADELPLSEGVVRVAFVPTAQLAAPRFGEITMRLDSFAVSGEIAARATPTDTVIVDESNTTHALRWPGGIAHFTAGAPTVVGRPHPDAPARFVALEGAGAKINKQHFWIAATSTKARIGRFAKANPVHVNGTSIAGGEEVEVALPAEVSLSHGDLVITVLAV
jgi:Protein of unknown function (DUF3662)